MVRRLVLAAFLAAVLVPAGNAAAATFYVSPSGSDSAAGDAAHPWRTVGHVNGASLQPGDTVLFQGGSTFSDTSLMPAQSGSASAPITFGSYGSGKANLSGGIWFSQKSYLTFDGLAVDAGSSPGDLSAIQASASGTGSTNIVITNCALTHVRIGINSANPGDGNWTIGNNLIQYTRDSGAIVLGHDLAFTNNSILDTGQDSSIAYGKHGVYAKGPSLTFRGNVIRRFSANGISLRYHDALVVGNTISDGPIGIAWFQVDPGTGGTTTIAYNRISNTSSSGIYVSPSDAGGSTRESFVIADNTVSGSGGNGGDLGATAGSLTLANNVFAGAVSPALRVFTPGGTYSEHHDSFSSTSAATQIVLGANWLTLAAYRTASGQGASDLAVDPQLGGDLTPAATSPLVDGGSQTAGALTYTASCDGAPFHYCGSAPDIGAVETATAALPPPAPLAAPTGLSASATQTAVTLTWTAAADPRVSSYAINRNGSSAATATGTSATISGLTCGTSSTFDVRSVAVDGSTSAAVTVAATTGACPAPAPAPAPKDTTPPWVMITSPANGATVPLSTIVRADATDASGIVDVTFWVDGTVTCSDKTAPYTCAVTLKKGQHTLLVRATDGAGNVAWMSVKVAASQNAPATTTTMSGIAPASGSSVARTFTLALPTVKAASSVTFRLDAKTVCVDREAPFRCAASASQGWHRFTAQVVRSGSWRTLSSRFRVR